MATREELLALVRGHVVVVDFAPARGHEQVKIRPALVVSSNLLNRTLQTVIVVPFGSVKGGRKPHLHEVLVRAGEGGLDKDSFLQASQVRTIDRFERIKSITGTVSNDTLEKIRSALDFALGGLP